jgi:hypothetical protein
MNPGMIFAYADPPYFGCADLYRETHPDAGVWDSLDSHSDLIKELVRDYPDGWALSLSSVSLRHILPLCPEDCRVGAWVKPFAAFKPHVNPAYAWEPVIFRGGRKRGREVPTVRDWIAKEITLQKGLVGAKPVAFCEWILQLLGFDPATDRIDDLFPGTGILGRVVAGLKCDVRDAPLFMETPA